MSRWRGCRRRRAPHRVHVEKRRPVGFDAMAAALTGRRWSYWCSCNGIAADPLHSQPQALAAGLAHLATAHGRSTP